MSCLTLYVSVRWFWNSGPGRLDVDVDIDGTPVTKGAEFPSPQARKRPDSFEVELPTGRHRLCASSSSQGTRFEVEFTIARIHRYAELSYDYYPKDHPYYQDYRPFDPKNPSGHREGFRFEIREDDFGWR